VARRECQIGITLPNRSAVDGFVAAARRAGAEIRSEPQQQPWGYCGVFADPDGHQWIVLEQTA
jgi:predicted lactoylglutathione lyase